MPSSCRSFGGGVDRRAHHLGAAKRVNVDDAARLGRTSCAIAAPTVRGMSCSFASTNVRTSRASQYEKMRSGVTVERFETDLDDHVELVELVDEPLCVLGDSGTSRATISCGAMASTLISFVRSAVVIPTFACPTISEIEPRLRPAK